MLSLILRIIFGCALVGNLIWAVIIGKIIHFLPVKKQTANGCSLVLASWAFWVAITVCPWIRYIPSGDPTDMWKKIMEKQAASGRPIMLVGNHVSFLDTPFVSSRFPMQYSFRMKTYMKQALMDLPILGALSRNCGHFLVPYVKDDSFSVHHDKMDAVDDQVEAHISEGGWLCFFPEGQLNKTPDEIQSIRHGGMKRAIKFDAIIISLVYHGHEKVWPIKAAIGGFPGKVQWSLKVMAPDGAKSFVKKLMEDGVDEPAQKKRKPSSDKPDYEVLAEYVQEYLQSHYDEVKADAGDKKD